MKILMLSVDWASKGGGGITRFARGFVQGLVANNIDVELLIEEDGPNSQKTGVTEYGCKIHSVLFKSSPIKRAFAFMKKLSCLCKKETYDFMIAITWSPCGTGAFFHNIFNKTPYWVVCHGNDILEPQRSFFYKHLMKVVLKKARVVLTNSKFTGGIVHSLGVKKSVIRAIGCGINPKELDLAFSKDTIRDSYAIGKKPLLVTIGRLVARKGQDMVIQALPTIVKSFPDATYLIVGEGDDKNRLQQLTSKLHVEKSVIFTGFISDLEMYQSVSECDLFVMASRNIMEKGDVEGFGIVFLEAGFYKKPVIAGRAGGMTDPVIENKTGLLVDPNNPEEIAEKAIQLLSNKSLCKEMGETAFDRIVTEYTWDAVAKRALAMN